MTSSMRVMPSDNGVILVVNHITGQNERTLSLVEQALKEYDDSCKVCPNCEKVGKVETMFGYREVRRKQGKISIPQSWCVACRSTKKAT